MADVYASAQWFVEEGREEEFEDRWREFLAWSQSAHPGLERARLLRNEGDASHYVSFAEWSGLEARDGWTQDPEFARLFGRCRELCRDVRSGPYAEAVRVG